MQFPADQSPQGTVPAPAPATAREMYDAMRLQRETIMSQLHHVEQDRRDLASELRDPTVTGADRAGLEARIAQADARITELQTQLAAAQTQEARAAGVPGSRQRHPEEAATERAELFFGLGMTITFVILLPLMIAHARRIWRKHAVTISLTPELTQRLDAIERGVEATSIEVERIGEGQRFVTRLLAARGERVPSTIGAGRESDDRA
jgi:hypothetical protein